MCVVFSYGDYKDKITIKKLGVKKGTIIVEYLGKEKEIKTSNFTQGRFLNLIINPNLIQLYKIGDIINSKKLGYKFRIINFGVQKDMTTKQEKIIYTCQCLDCGHIFKREQRLVKEFGCPNCSPRTKKHISESNITITAPWMIQYFQGGYEEAKLHRKCEQTKINPVCPVCGKIRKIPISISDLYERGLSCECSAHMSFPERFMVSLLDQLNVDYIFQPSMKFLKFEKTDRRYDFYIPKLSTIIETHGRQHYKTGELSSWQTAEEQQKIDRHKREVAIKNHIKNYIELDCRKSNLSWIKDSIMNSSLPGLLSFEEKDIDWIKCVHYNNLMIKKVCDDYRDNYMTVAELMKKYNMAKTTINRYLKMGMDYGWCVFTREVNTNMKPIEILKDNMHIAYFKNKKDVVNNFGCIDHISFTGLSDAIKNNRKYKGYTIKMIDDIPLKWDILTNQII